MPYSLYFIPERQQEVVYEYYGSRSVDVSCQYSAILWSTVFLKIARVTAYAWSTCTIKRSNEPGGGPGGMGPGGGLADRSGVVVVVVAIRLIASYNITNTVPMLSIHEECADCAPRG